jgi:uncharacterized membrane protein
LKRLRTSLKNYFLTGLLVILPIFITVKVILFLITGMDAILKIIPAKYLPDTYLQVHIPGLGLIFVVILVLAVGLLTKNIVGRKIVRLGENIVERIPLVRILYAGVKQLLETIFLQKTDAFKRVGLVQYPRRGTYVIGFITGESKGEVQDKTDKNMMNVFIPTTPNPTSGFYILIPEDEVVMLNMTVEDAFKLIISGGIVSPPK